MRVLCLRLYAFRQFTGFRIDTKLPRGKDQASRSRSPENRGRLPWVHKLQFEPQSFSWSENLLFIVPNTVASSSRSVKPV